MSPLSSNPTNAKPFVVAKPTASSGSSEGCILSSPNIDEKKRRRMESNRESARRSRQRKQQHLDDLIKQVGNLTRENEEISKKIGEVSRVFETFDAQNKVLKTHKDKLAERLESLESIIEISKVVRGSNNNDSNNNYDDPMMKPWQLPCPSMPIIAASSGVKSFKF